MWLRCLGQVTWVGPGWVLGGSWVGPGWVLGVLGSLVALSRLNLIFAQSRLESGFLGNPHLDKDLKSYTDPSVVEEWRRRR